jgi:hypothetical protein
VPSTKGDRLARDLWSRIRLRTGIRRYALDVLDALGRPPLRSDTGSAVRTLVVGNDPIRLLLFGGGIGVAYGVTSRQDAVDGPLARIMAERSGRGVVVENRAQQHVLLPDTAASLGGAGAHTFHAAIWFPSFADGLQRLSLRSWRIELTAMIAAVRAETAVPLVLTCVPVPIGTHPAALVARPWVLAINRVILGVAAEHDRTVAVATQPFVPRELGAVVTGPAYFEAVADRVADGVGRLIGLPCAAGDARHGDGLVAEPTR